MSFKYSLLILGLLAANLGLAQAAPVRRIVPKGAVSFTSKAQRFSVWLPEKPKLDNSVTLEKGKKVSTLSLNATSQMNDYIVIATPILPQEARSNSKHRYALLLKDMLKEFGFDKAKSIKRTEIQLDSFNGYELKALHSNGKIILHTRLYYTPKAFYQIIRLDTAANEQKQAAQINRVFDSFRILPQ